MEEMLQTILLEVQSINSRLGVLEKKVDSLETGFGSLEKKVDSLETRFGSLETKVDSLETRFETRFDLLETRIGSLESEVKEGFARMERLMTGIPESYEGLETVVAGHDRLLEKLSKRSIDQEADMDMVKRSLQ